jgi:hypothetical protein
MNYKIILVYYRILSPKIKLLDYLVTHQVTLLRRINCKHLKLKGIGGSLAYLSIFTPMT